MLQNTKYIYENANTSESSSTNTNTLDLFTRYDWFHLVALVNIAGIQIPIQIPKTNTSKKGIENTNTN